MQRQPQVESRPPSIISVVCRLALSPFYGCKYICDICSTKRYITMKNAINCLLFITLGILTLAGCKKVMPPPPPPVLPAISSISPAMGVAGAQVTISGSNFDPAAANNTVKFNGTQATIVSATTTTLVVNAPVSGATG